jgi:hypothetical protein
VVCRAWTRRSFVERTVEVTLDVQPNRIYQLSAPHFTAPDFRCDVTATPLGSADAKRP